jgi:hypothetical protein
MGEPCIGHRLFSRTEMGDGVGDVGGVPEHDRGDDEVEAGGTKLLRLGTAVGNPALFVADRPEQRPLLVAAVASRLEVVVDAPPTPPTEPSAGVERWIGSIKLYRLWLKRRSSCLSPSLGAYGLQDAPPRSGQPNTTS